MEGSVFHADRCSFIDHRTSEAELPLWLHRLGSCTGPHTQGFCVLGLMLCCCRLDILNTSGQRILHFHLLLGPVNYRTVMCKR